MAQGGRPEDNWLMIAATLCQIGIFISLTPSPPPKLNAQGEFKIHSPNCDRINVAAPDKTDLIWMVTLSTLESRAHYSNKERQKWEEEQSQQSQERIRFTIILED